MSAGAELCVELWVSWHLATSGCALGSGCSAGLGLPESEELRLAVCWAHWLRSLTESYGHTQSSADLLSI